LISSLSSCQRISWQLAISFLGTSSKQNKQQRAREEVEGEATVAFAGYFEGGYNQYPLTALGIFLIN